MALAALQQQKPVANLASQFSGRTTQFHRWKKQDCWPTLASCFATADQRREITQTKVYGAALESLEKRQLENGGLPADEEHVKIYCHDHG